MKKERSMFWDNYKGILIVLVVFGHFIYSYANNLPESLAYKIYLTIYSFHMPAFVFCSGYFSKSERTRNSQVLIKLLLYYLVFNTLMLLFSYFYLGNDVKILTPYYSYWYILSLIFRRLMIGRFENVKLILIVSIMITLFLGYSKEFSNLLSMRRTLGFFCFFAMGYFFDKEKVEMFIRNRTKWHIACGIVGSTLLMVFCLNALGKIGITPSITMLNPYKQATDIFLRLVCIICSGVTITGMLLSIPKCKIPFLSKIGKNSLLIYLGHRFLTILFYRELFTYKTYSDIYLIYAFIATIFTCLLLGGDKINGVTERYFSKFVDKIWSLTNRKGNCIGVIIIFVVLVMLCLNMIIKIID